MSLGCYILIMFFPLASCENVTQNRSQNKQKKTFEDCIFQGLLNSFFIFRVGQWLVGFQLFFTLISHSTLFIFVDFLAEHITSLSAFILAAEVLQFILVISLNYCKEIYFFFDSRYSNIIFGSESENRAIPKLSTAFQK